MRIVNVKTDDFEADVYDMTEMPAQRVLELFGSTDDITRAVKTVELMKSAIVTPEGQAAFESLSFFQMMNAINAWLDLTKRTPPTQK